MKGISDHGTPNPMWDLCDTAHAYGWGNIAEQGTEDLDWRDT